MTELDDTSECLLCAKDRTQADLQPNRLVMLPITTEHQNIPIQICPDCDGGILDLVKKTWNWSDV